ncbi:MAG: transporter permease [Candidatus Eremiobacteraeota bacterium]|nr:transporter permease [Candidatus Eremiobacteraeota bacterium]
MKRRLAAWAPPAAFVVAVTLAVEALARSGLLTRHVPPPSAIFVALWRELANGSLSSQIGVTLATWAVAFVTAVALAIVVGLLMGTIPLMYDALSTLVDLLRPVPSVSLIPLAVLFFGLGPQMRLVMIVYASFWPMLINTLYGVRSVDPLALDTARNFGLSRLDTLARVVLPASLAGIATGVRVSASLALAVTVTVELVVGDSGIGHYIAQAEQSNRIAPMYAAIVLSGLIGWLINAAFSQLEARVVFWSPASRRSAEAL